MAEASPTTPPAGTTATPAPTATVPTTPSTTQPTSSTTPQTPPPTSETKPDEGSLLGKVKDGEDKPEAKAPAGAPEKYADFKAPEGYEIDPAQMEPALALFKELNLTQEQAQRLVDFNSKNAIDSSQNSLKAVKDMRADWVTKAKALPEIGTELGPEGKVVKSLGSALNSLVSTQVITRQVANDFKAAMDLTGAGDHPAFIQIIHALTQAFNEGTPVRGGGPSPHGQSPTGNAIQRRSAAQEMYPKLPSAQG